MLKADELLEVAVAASRDIGHLFNFIATADDEPGTLLATFLQGKDPPVDAFIGRDCGALGTRGRWSPDDVQPFKECWIIVAVAKGEPAVGAVGPYDGHWYRVEPLDLPWFMASTAGGIRSSIEKGEPLVFKQAKDKALFGRVRDGDVPPVDERGLI